MSGTPPSNHSCHLNKDLKKRINWQYEYKWAHPKLSVASVSLPDLSNIVHSEVWVWETDRRGF